MQPSTKSPSSRERAAKQPRHQEKHRFRIAALGSLSMWLILTAPSLSRADSSHSPLRHGPTLRLGSMAGTTEFRDEDVITIGVQGALGYQVGPIALEVEHERGFLTENRTGSNRGHTSRSALNARLYALNVARPFSAETRLRAYLEAGAGRSRGAFASGDKFSRSEGSFGGGLLLDQRNTAPRGRGVRYAGWHVGWSLRMSEPTAIAPSLAAACKKGACPTRMPTAPSGPDLNLMFISSINFAW